MEARGALIKNTGKMTSNAKMRKEREKEQV